MSLTIKKTSSSNIIEDTITFSITGGSIPSNTELWFVDEQGIIVYQHVITTNNVSVVLNQEELETVYGQTHETDKIQLNILCYQRIQSSGYQQISNEITTTMYITPEPPNFDSVGIRYYDTSQEAIAFTNDNKMIVRGLSNIHIDRIYAYANKYGYIKTIKANNLSFNWGDQYQFKEIDIDYSTNDMDPYLDLTVIDSRGWETTIHLVDISKFKYTYQKPRISEMNVERDGISETTYLTVKGYYSEGYQLGTTNLTSGYYYTENESGATEQTGVSTLVISKNISGNYQNFLDVLDEYNNPNYTTDSTGQYYSKSTFENNIKSLFDTSLFYNNKYTQEYLQADYDSTNERYYCISGGYNGNWKNFWDDTLKTIDKTMYDNTSDNEDGGNYEFEINQTIQGDLQTGFSLDKSFNVKNYIDDEIKATGNNVVQQTAVIFTALPAIDVYKDKVALHDIYDDTIGGDIQLNGDVYVNGEKLPEQKSSIKLKLSTNKSFSSKSAQKLTLSLDTSKGSKLTLSDGGVKIGAGITHVYASGQVYFYTGSNHADGKVCRIVKNTTTVSAFHCRTNLNYIHVGTSTIIPVQENDIIYLYCINDTTNASVIQNGSDNTFLNVIEL